MSDWRLRLFPREKREWGEAFLAEFGDEKRLGRLIVQAWLLKLENGDHMKAVVATTSIVNILFGLFMTSLFLYDGPNPPLVVITAACLIVQGGYTLWFMAGRAGDLQPWASLLLLSGQTLALLVGVGGLIVSMVQNTGASVDPEYGPIAVAGLVTAQAAATLYLYALKAPVTPISD